MKAGEVLIASVGAALIGSVSAPPANQEATKAEALQTIEVPCEIAVNEMQGKRVQSVSYYGRLPDHRYSEIWLCGYRSSSGIRQPRNRSKCVQATSKSIGDDGLYVWCGLQDRSLNKGWMKYSTVRGEQ